MEETQEEIDARYTKYTVDTMRAMEIDREEDTWPEYESVMEMEKYQ